MDVVTLIQLASVGGAVGFATAGFAAGRASGTDASGGDEQFTGGDDAGVALIASRLQEELAAARASNQRQKERMRALEELNAELSRRAEASPSSPSKEPWSDESVSKSQPVKSKTVVAPPPGFGNFDEVATLQAAINKLEKQLAQARAEVKSGRENMRAMKEALRNTSGAGGSSKPARGGNEDEVALLQGAVGRLERELGDTRRGYRDAKEKLAAMQQVVSAGGLSSSKTQVAKPAAGDDVALMQKALNKLELQLNASRREAADAKERVRALEQLIPGASRSDGSVTVRVDG